MAFGLDPTLVASGVVPGGGGDEDPAVYSDPRIVTLESFGVDRTGTEDCTQAIIDAFDSLEGEPGIVYAGFGDLLCGGAAGGSVELADGQVWAGGSKYGLRMRIQTGGDRRLFKVNGSRAAFYDTSFQGPGVPADGDQICALYNAGTDGGHIYAENCDFLGLQYGYRGFADIDQTCEFRKCLFDGQNIGLDAPDSVPGGGAMGILTPARGLVRVDECVFRRLGSNIDGVGNGDHALYLADDTPLWITNSRFTEHIDGRYIQHYDEDASTGAGVMFRVEGCYFGPQQVGNTMIHTINGGEAQIRNNHFDHGDVADGSRAIAVRGDALIEGNLFEGSSGEYYDIELDTANCDVQLVGNRFKSDRYAFVALNAAGCRVMSDANVFDGPTNHCFVVLDPGCEIGVRGGRAEQASYMISVDNVALPMAVVEGVRMAGLWAVLRTLNAGATFTESYVRFCNTTGMGGNGTSGAGTFAYHRATLNKGLDSSAAASDAATLLAAAESLGLVT